MRKSIFKKCSENYVNWVIRLGKVRSAILGIFVLGIFAILIQSLLNYVFFGTVVAGDIFRSILFGLLSAPFVLYFFNVIVEQLERSRLKLERSVYELNVMRTQDAYLSAKLKQNSVDKTQLMATISHELRTPLNGIIGLSRMLLEEELSQKQREYLQTINVSAVSLGYIFSDIIDLEKIDSQRIELFRQPVEFTQIIHDISHFAQLLAAKKSIQFLLDYPDNLPEFIEVDNARVSQVLWNLISNAVKFPPPSGHISLKFYHPDAHPFKFGVRDSGIGIPLEEQDKIFQMFYQAENSKAKKAQGSGIGLAISKQIALLMNGDLQVESEPNQGATFTFSFEAKQGKAKQALQIKHYGLKVLLVEDVELNVVVARSMLEKFGCEIEVAMTGEQAQQKFEQHSFDLILLDIQLPDTTGTQLAQQWRAQYDEGEIDYLPLLVALTANMMQTKSEYQQQGMDDVLRKPLSLECLAQCLALHFGEDSPISDLQNEVEIRPLAEKDMIADGRLNGALIQELCSVLGEEGLQKSIVLFESLTPSYILSLKQAYQDWQGTPDAIHRKLLTEQAHKYNGGDWEAGIADWLAEIDQHWQSDLALLKSKFDG